jgi:hypothetical protein
MVIGTKLYFSLVLHVYVSLCYRFTVPPFESVITYLINLCIWEIVGTARLHVCIPGAHGINVSSGMAEMDL